MRMGAPAVAITSLFAAADEDIATGGPDLVRRIFPTIAIINEDGYIALTDDEVARRAEVLLSGRERGGDPSGASPSTSAPNRS